MSKPGYVANIVVACAILHNIAIRNGIDLDLPDDEEMLNRDGQIQVAEDREVGPGNQQLQRGLRARQRIVRNYFDHN